MLLLWSASILFFSLGAILVGICCTILLKILVLQISGMLHGSEWNPLAKYLIKIHVIIQEKFDRGWAQRHFTLVILTAGKNEEIVNPRGVFRLFLRLIAIVAIAIIILIFLPLGQILQFILIQHPLSMHVGMLVIILILSQTTMTSTTTVRSISPLHCILILILWILVKQRHANLQYRIPLWHSLENTRVPFAGQLDLIRALLSRAREGDAGHFLIESDEAWMKVRTEILDGILESRYSM
mmetsp:Transcript_31305/g.65929  ORF Transcript_31305/g.65929 Transcript_31305/m.65929 type:complete len:240 (-) Transcript_31305:1404-2123(-)